MGTKLYFGNYVDVPPITQVTTKAQRVLKFKPTDLATGLRKPISGNSATFFCPNPTTPSKTNYWPPPQSWSPLRGDISNV
jgi:hypothetical protein